MILQYLLVQSSVICAHHMAGYNTYSSKGDQLYGNEQYYLEWEFVVLSKGNPETIVYLCKCHLPEYLHHGIT